MNIAFYGSNYCGHFDPLPPPHESVWLPFAPSLAEMFAAVGKTPDWADVLVVTLAETSPMPFDLEQCPCPTVATTVDWSQWSDALFAHAKAFDFVMANQSVVEGLGRHFPEKMRRFSAIGNFSNVRPSQPPKPFAERPREIAFIGGIFPTEHYEGRNRGLSRLVRLVDRFDIRILSRLTPDEYLDTLCSTKIAFNHASWTTQQSVNARYYEAGECRALVLAEADNAAVRAEFSEREALYYDDSNLADRIEWALTHPDDAQAMIDRFHLNTTTPAHERYLPILEEIVSTNARHRSPRNLYDHLIGLTCGFGNWGKQARRHPSALGMLMQLASQNHEKNARNPVWLNLLGVAIAEIAEELDRLGASADAESLRNDPNLSPTRLWGRSARLAPKSASPLYNLSRFNIWRQQFARAGGYLRNAATLLEDFGGDALFAPSLTFPIWTENVQALDRTLVFHLNERAFEAVSDAERQSKRAALMLWRARELLGDLAHHERKPDEAYAHYHRAADAAPHLATEAMRKSIELGESKGDASWVIASLERLVEANPLDLPHRERLKELYAEEGRSDDELDETVRLLTKAVPNRATFNRAPIERL